MKRIIKWIGSITLIVLTSGLVVAQKIDEERMKRDLAVAENVLATLIKQKFDNKRLFFSLEIKGSYQEGYGVTFSLPPDYNTPIAFTISGSKDHVIEIPGRNEYHIYSDDEDVDREKSKNGKVRKEVVIETVNDRQKSKEVKMDSVRDIYNSRLIEASKEFLADYGDIISQLNANERIVITNRGERPKMWVNHFTTTSKRSHLSIELLKSEINQYKQNKISRDQLMSRIKIVNTETVETVEPDLELLSSIFNRLYRSDLSKTYFTFGNIYYERLKDFGVIYYMQVYSSNRLNDNLYSMPTIKENEVSQQDRDKKVKEMYPAFEKELKENMLEYGRTLKSLKDDEVLVVNVKLTKCSQCEIPSTVEMSVKGSVLKEYGSGKIDKSNALNKVNVKKGSNQ